VKLTEKRATKKGVDRYGNKIKKEKKDKKEK